MLVRERGEVYWCVERVVRSLISYAYCIVSW